MGIEAISAGPGAGPAAPPAPQPDLEQGSSSGRDASSRREAGPAEEATSRPGLAAPPVADWARPGRTAARLARHVEVSLAELDLTLPQYRILMFLSERAEGPPGWPSSLAVTRPSVTAVVDGLVASWGWWSGETCTDDRRRVDHVLTRDGRKLLNTRGTTRPTPAWAPWRPSWATGRPGTS